MVQSSLPVRPTEIRWLSETELSITWADGHVSRYPFLYLRERCPCAVCNETRAETGELRVLSEPPDEMKALDIGIVGNYAVQFLWSDGHDTGIYPYNLLRDLCACSQCQAKPGGM